VEARVRVARSARAAVNASAGCEHELTSRSQDADVEAPAPRTMSELRQYCDGTAGSMMQLALEACGAGDEGAAAEAARLVARRACASL